MKCWVYILSNKKGLTYTGWAFNIRERLREHYWRRNQFTAKYRINKLVFRAAPELGVGDRAREADQWVAPREEAGAHPIRESRMFRPLRALSLSQLLAGACAIGPVHRETSPPATAVRQCGAVR